MPDAPTVWWLVTYRDRAGRERRYVVPEGATPQVPDDHELVGVTSRFTAASLAGLHVGSRMAADAIAEHIARAARQEAA